MILINGLRAIGIEFNIIRILHILSSELTEMLSWGYVLLYEVNSFHKNLLTMYNMLSVLLDPGGKGREIKMNKSQCLLQGVFPI